MCTETPVTQRMRKAIQPFLPSKAFLKRDRGEGFLVTNASIFAPELEHIPGFILEKAAPLLRILPDESWLLQMEEAFPEAPDYFSKTLIRFRKTEISRENLLLFAEGLKLLDAESSDTSSYERTLRQRCALALRGACGGGLYACAILLMKINTLNKGDKNI